MKKYEKEVLQSNLDNEKAVIQKLKKSYKQALKDINAKIERLMSRQDADMQYVIYQVEHQQALKQQIEAILNIMQAEEFVTISEYITRCYEDGYAGVFYSLHNQGVPLMLPLDQEAMVQAVQLDSKISEGLYTRLGEDVDELKKKISAEVSRSISTAIPYQQVARNLEKITNIGYNNAIRIARTEGNRVNNQAAMNACYKAKSKGCKILKQWCATLDAKTRDSHAMVDGEIREVDEKFSNGLMFPSDPNGIASEVVNCRCTMLQRAKWGLDEDDLTRLQDRANFYGLDKTANFDEFKQKYLQVKN